MMAPRTKGKAIPTCMLSLNNPELLGEWYMGLEKSNSVLTDLRASAKACELTCVEIIEQIQLYGLKVINPEFRKAMDTFRKSS